MKNAAIPSKKVFLGGTCNGSDWREILIPQLEIDYFNPVVAAWTPECEARELQQRQTCDFCSMKYDIEQLKNDQTTHKFLFFWGHQPEQDGSIGKGCLSQWYSSAFEVDGIRYLTAEHWMMAQKALLFDDHEVFQQICAAATAPEAKKLGRAVRNYQDDIWVAHRFEIVKTGNGHKFSQNEALRTFLLQTKRRVLVEASPVDPIWGIGMAADHPKVHDPANWQGLNLLGFALMEVRDQLSA